MMPLLYVTAQRSSHNAGVWVLDLRSMPVWSSRIIPPRPRKWCPYCIFGPRLCCFWSSNKLNRSPPVLPPVLEFHWTLAYTCSNPWPIAPQWCPYCMLLPRDPVTMLVTMLVWCVNQQSERQIWTWQHKLKCMKWQRFLASRLNANQGQTACDFGPEWSSKCDEPRELKHENDWILMPRR